MARLRATAHPVRLRILSLLTAEAMSAAEVARALDITHANASYHLRVLARRRRARGRERGEDPRRGGQALPVRRHPRGRRTASSPVDDRIAYARANALEVERRLLDAAAGSGSSSDLEAWVPVETWRRALDLLHEASHLLHAEARPAGTADTVHVSATTNAFTMTGGLDRRAAARRRPMTWADAAWRRSAQRNFAWYFSSRLVNTLGA